MSDIIERVKLLDSRYRNDTYKTYDKIHETINEIEVDKKYNNETLSYLTKHTTLINVFVNGILDKFNITYEIHKRNISPKDVFGACKSCYEIEYIIDNSGYFNKKKIDKVYSVTINDIKKFCGDRWTVEYWLGSTYSLMRICFGNKDEYYGGMFKELMNLKDNLNDEYKLILDGIDDWFNECIVKDKILDINDFVYACGFKCGNSFIQSLLNLEIGYFKTIDDIKEQND